MLKLKHSSAPCVGISLRPCIRDPETCHSQAGRPNGRPGHSSTCREIKHESFISQNKQFNMGSRFQNFHWKTSRLNPCKLGYGPRHCNAEQMEAISAAGGDIFYYPPEKIWQDEGMLWRARYSVQRVVHSRLKV